VAVMILPPWLKKSIMRAEQFQSRQYKIPSPFAQAHLVKDMCHHYFSLEKMVACTAPYRLLHRTYMSIPKARVLLPSLLS